MPRRTVGLKDIAAKTFLVTLQSAGAMSAFQAMARVLGPVVFASLYEDWENGRMHTCPCQKCKKRGRSSFGTMAGSGWPRSLDSDIRRNCRKGRGGRWLRRRYYADMSQQMRAEVPFTMMFRNDILLDLVLRLHQHPPPGIAFNVAAEHAMTPACSANSRRARGGQGSYVSKEAQQ